MQYKGEDLDLRVPHGRAPRETYVPDYEPTAGNGRWPRTQPYAAGPDPLWVDEVLLACCNYAFDVAQANGAAEVSLEHLVNALTRVDAAARQLESRGVREGQLRRESAALIASEIPAANAGDAAAPRRSGELEEILRRSSDIAHRRGSAAGVDDVLWVLLHYNRDLPVVLLLRRLTPDWQRSDWGRLREPAPEPLARPVHLVANDGVHARMASMEDGLRLMQAEFAAERKLLMDLVRDIQRDVVAQRGDGASFRNDLGQRLESLERAVHTRADGSRIPAQLADRISQLEKTVHGGLGEAQRSARELGQRLTAFEATVSDAIAIPGQHGLAERMSTLEKAVHGGLGEGARNWAHLGQRLAQLEAAVERRDQPALDVVSERIGALERTMQQSLTDGARNHGLIGQRLSAFETLLGSNATGQMSEALQSRLAAIERRLETVGGESPAQQARLAERFAELGRLIEASRGEATKVRTDVADRLSSIESYLAEGPTTPDAAVRELSERLGGLERAVRSGFGDAAATTGQIAERLAVVERGVADRPRDDGEALLILDERLGAIERMLDTRGQQALSANAEVVERLKLLEQRPVSQVAFDAAAFAPLDQRLVTLEGVSTTRIDALHTSLGTISTRLDQLDERMRAEAVVTEEALRGRDQDFDFIYNEIKQLGQSQATLNSAVNDWRNESQEHFGTLATRLDKLAPSATAGSTEGSRTPAAAGDLPASLRPKEATVVVSAAAPAPGTANVSADDYALPDEPGRGFWYWLFGTRSVAKANRENNLKVQRMRDNIRDARERRKIQA